MTERREPTGQFVSREHAMDYVREWQDRLFLNDWIIDLNLEENWSCAENGHCLAENDYQPTLRTSVITMDKKTHYGVMKQPHELVLVHELLHLKFLFSENVPETTEGLYFGMMEHIAIEEIARSLLMAKYNISPDWFRNERIDNAD